MVVGFALAVVLAATLCAALIVALLPTLQRHALARPNARSSHEVPTPQGGGIAIVAATLLTGFAALLVSGHPLTWQALVLALATLAVAIVGAIDDVRPLKPRTRFAVQALAVTAVVLATDGRLFPALPLPLERLLEIVAGLWFVNLTNFTDGLDWMSLACVVPLAATLAALGLAGLYPPLPGLVATALLGSLLGFAPFNRPVARLFMGDAGALAIGLIVTWLLYRLALEGGLAAALILPLYAVSDTTLTLLWRLRQGEKFWRPHRHHFFHVAADSGVPVLEIVGSVFALNLALACLATTTLLWPSWPVTLLSLAGAATLVAIVLRRFAAGGRGEDLTT